MTVLEIDNLTKRFGGIVALQNVSLSLDSGVVYGLMGANGAGKTTLFNVVTGFYAPTDGTIQFDGQTVNDLGPTDLNHRGLARTFQTPRQYEDMTVFENVMIGALFGNSDSVEDPESYTREVLEFVGLNPVAEKPATEITVTQVKKMQIARCLATRPSTILVDEGCSGLNASETEQLLDIYEKLRDRNLTVWIIEHDVDALTRVSDKIHVLDNGELIAQGPPEQVTRDETVIEAYLGGQHA